MTSTVNGGEVQFRNGPHTGKKAYDGPRIYARHMTSHAPFFIELDALVARIDDGCKLALPPDYSGCAMAAVRRLIARGARGLHLIGVPVLGLQGD